MTDLLLSKHFATGRSEPISLIVLHSTEGPTTTGAAHAVAAWFAGPDSPIASAHFVVGQETIVGCVDEADTAWHAAPVNHRSVGIEHTGWARYTAADWAQAPQQAMLKRSAALVADICTRRKLPAAFVDAEGLLRGDPGITTHATVSEACRLAIARKLTPSIFAANPNHPGTPISNHTDPGTAFPMTAYLAMVRAAQPAPVDPGEPPDQG